MIYIFCVLGALTGIFCVNIGRFMVYRRSRYSLKENTGKNGGVFENGITKTELILPEQNEQPPRHVTPHSAARVAVPFLPLRILNCSTSYMLWGAIGIIGFALIYSCIINPLSKIECVVVLIACMLICIVDIYARKIPNSLLLIMFAIRVLFIALNPSGILILDSVAGLGLAFAVSVLLLKKRFRLGAGDIKFAAVIGFFTGTGGLFQALLTAAAVYIAHLFLTRVKIRNISFIRTAIAPYLAIGMFITLLYPVF